MDVKAAPTRLRSAWNGWWHCHKQLRRLREHLERSGVADYDPLYPLIFEIGMVPARLSRLLVVFAIAVIGGLVAVEVVRDALGKLWEPVRVVSNGAGGRLVILDARGGARFLKCAQVGQVCVELLAEPRGAK